METAKLTYECMCLMASSYQVILECASEIDAIFIWGRAKGEWEQEHMNESVLKVAADLHSRSPQAYVAIPGYTGSVFGQGKNGYPGPVVWSQVLNTFGVPNKSLVIIEGNGTNTKSEMDDFLTLATERGWLKVIAISLFTHALRAMMGVVMSLNNKQQLEDMQIFPCWPQKMNFAKQVYGSQGEGPYPRSQWLGLEFDRIPKYLAQGDLCTLGELKDYLTIICT